MITTRDEALAELRNRALPAILERIWNRQIPRPLVGSCDEPRRYFQILPGLQETFLKSKGYVPLWETNLESIVAFDMERGLYVRYYYGEGDDQVLGKSYQQFLSSFFIELADSGVPDEDLEVLAGEFGYKHLEALRHFLDSVDPDDYREANRAFISTIP